MPVKRSGKLRGMGPKLENAQKRSLILSAMLVAQRASDRAPIDTGRLKRSLIGGSEVADDNLKGLPYLVAPGIWGIDVGTNVEYAFLQEELQPYLIPALQESRDEIVTIFIQNIRAAFR